jgi:hypothetical protein
MFKKKLLEERTTGDQRAIFGLTLLQDANAIRWDKNSRKAVSHIVGNITPK